MELTFSAAGILNRGRGLTFDDVLIVPSMSAVRSRKDPALGTRVTRNHRLEAPFLSANMDTVTESAMAIAMSKLGGLGILHRFMTVEQQANEVRLVKDSGSKQIAASIGVNGEGHTRAEALVKAGANILTIDIAHGRLKSSGDIVKALAAGAETVMLGSLLAGSIETPGEIHKGKKHYRGMASRAAQVSWRGGLPEGMAPEGESTAVAVKGSVKDVLMELSGGLR